MQPNRPAPSSFRRLLIPLCATLSTIVCSAQTPAASVDPATLARYDVNQNGVLDPTERATMDAAAANIPVTTTTPGQDGSANVVSMSPFTVEVGEDTGYYASNTLSGTRLNSRIEDLASSITVVTKQQMQDMAALDINDIFLYEANTEGTGNYTAFSVGRNGDVNDAIQDDPATANRVRGIDSANTARGNYATNSSIPIDPYNIDAVEISRGPNSNIFGLGNASGTVNVIPTRANLTREINQAVLRADSYGGYRGSIDINRPLLNGKLALRASAMFENKGFTRDPSKETTRRQQVLLTAQPFTNTMIRASFENYSQFARRPNSITPRDTVTYWNEAGRPTWDPVNFTAKIGGVAVGTFTEDDDDDLPLGLRASGTTFYNRPSMFIDNGTVGYWSVNRTTSGSNANQPNTDVRFVESGTAIMRLRGSDFPLFTTPGISDQSLYDWESINYIAPNYSQSNAQTYNVELEQFILNTPMHLLAFQGGWFREDSKRYSRNFINGNSAILNVDVNETLLDGSPNPYFLRPYLGASEPTAFRRPSLNDIYRGQLAYQLDLTRSENRWLAMLGRHRLSAYGEDRKITDSTLRYWEVVLSDHSWLNTANRANSAAAARAYTRYYLGDDVGQNIDYAPPPVYTLAGTYDFNWFNGATDEWVTESADFGEAARSAAGRSQRHIKTKGLVTQNFFWGGRIVTTAGWRNDNQRSRNSLGPTVNPDTGLVDHSRLSEWRDWTEGEGDTKTWGVVVKPLEWLNLHYNESDSFRPASVQYTLFGEELPNPTGTGKDYGFSVSFFGGKLIAKINRYENVQKNSRGGDAGTIATRANRMDFGSEDWNLEDWARDVVTLRFQNQGIMEPTDEQMLPQVAELMGVPEDFVSNIQGKSRSSTSDVTGEGYELEVAYNPVRYWTLKITGAQQKSIDDNMSPDIVRYIEQRLPVWTTVRDDAGNLWWDLDGDFGGPAAFLNSIVQTPLRLATANQGKARNQVREWRLNALTNLQLAGVTDRRWLRDMSVGGAVRWESRGAIGYLGSPDDDGVIRDLDPNRPYYDDARASFDFNLAYRTRLFNDRVNARFQVNVRNAFEGGELRVVGVNPDGSPHSFRIIDPRQFILTTTFDF